MPGSCFVSSSFTRCLVSTVSPINSTYGCLSKHPFLMIKDRHSAHFDAVVHKKRIRYSLTNVNYYLDDFLISCFLPGSMLWSAIVKPTCFSTTFITDLYDLLWVSSLCYPLPSGCTSFLRDVFCHVELIFPREWFKSLTSYPLLLKCFMADVETAQTILRCLYVLPSSFVMPCL